MNAQTSVFGHIVAGLLTTTGSGPTLTATGGTLILYPPCVADTLSGLNIPKGVTVQMLNFTSANSMTIDEGGAATSPSVLIKGAIVNAGGLSLTTVSNLQPLFQVASTGSIKVTGNLGITNAGSINISGTTSASGILTLANSPSTDSGITIAANVTGTKGVTIFADPTGAGYSGTAGTLASSGAMTVLAPTISLVSTGKLSSPVSISVDNNLNGGLISLEGADTFNLTGAVMRAMVTPNLKIGSLSDNGDITIGNSLNASGLTTPGVPIGSKSLTFLTGGDFSAAGKTLTLGKNKVTITADNIAPGNISGGTGATLTGGAGGIALAAPITLASGNLVLTTTGGGNIDVGGQLLQGTSVTVNASGHLISAGASLQGSTVALGAGASGIDPITTSATTLAINTTGGATVTDSNAKVTVIASSVSGSLTFTDSASLATLTIGGPLSAGALALTMQGLTSKIVIASPVMVTSAATLTATGAGTITQTVPKSGPQPLITASSLTIQTGAWAIGSSKGSLNISVNSLTLHTTGAVFISDKSVVNLQTSSAGSLALVDTAQDLVATNAINVLGPLTATSTVSLKATNATAGSINLAANVTITPLVAGGTTALTLVSSGSGGPNVLGGGISAANGVTLTSTALTATAGSSGITLGNNNISVTAGSLAANSTGDVVVTDTAAALSLGPSTGGANFEIDNFAGSAGTLTVAGTVKAAHVALKAGSGSTSNLLLNANVTGTSSVLLQTAVNGNESGKGQILGGGALTLDVGGSVGSVKTKIITNVTSETGTIGGSLFQSNASTNPLTLTGLTVGGATPTIVLTSLGGVSGSTVDANFMTVTAGGTGSVNISNSYSGAPGNLNLSSSAAGSSFTLSTTGSLTISGTGVVTHAPTNSSLGSISLINNLGAMNINGSVAASGGSVALLNNDTATGTVSIADFVKITTFAVSGTGKTSAISDQIAISIGPAGTGIAGSFTSGITVLQTPPGQAFPGSNPTAIVKTGLKPSTVNALKCNVIFNSPSSSRTITIGQGVSIVADPVVGATLSTGHQLAPVLGTASTSVPASVSTGEASNGTVSMVRALHFTANLNPIGWTGGSGAPSFLVGLNTAPSSPIAGTLRSVSPGSDADNDYDEEVDHRIASRSYVQALSGEFDRQNELYSLESNVGSARYAGNAGITFTRQGAINLAGGEVLFVAKKSSLITAGALFISLAPGAVVLVSKTPEAVKVRDLHDCKANSVRAYVRNGPSRTVAPGEELALSRNAYQASKALADGIGRRRVDVYPCSDGKCLLVSEFSVINLLSSNRLLALVRTSVKQRQDKRLVESLLKTSAVLLTITQGHGNFSVIPATDPVSAVATAWEE